MVIFSFKPMPRRGKNRLIFLKSPVEDGGPDSVLSESFEVPHVYLPKKLTKRIFPILTIDPFQYFFIDSIIFISEFISFFDNVLRQQIFFDRFFMIVLSSNDRSRLIRLNVKYLFIKFDLLTFDIGENI